MAARKVVARLSQPHLLGIEPLTVEDIELVLSTAQKYQTRPEVPGRGEAQPVLRSDLLAGKSLVLAFFEPSTRTRISFEMAADRLGMDVVNLALEASSVQKGESLLDTVKTLVAMRPDALVIRHQSSGVPHFLARHTEVPILNAGDGLHEHPTQALLDALTIRAAMNALFECGRPARVQLCVLIDRGWRELPIEATYVGRHVQTAANEIIEVRLREVDPEERVMLVEKVLD